MGLFNDKKTKAVEKALKVLGKKNLALIMHSNSFPALDGEDVGFGTVNSSAAKNLIEYISGTFNMLQLGPAGKTKSCDASPYTSTIFSGNPLSIDLKALTTSEWSKILSVKTFNEIVENNPNKNKGRTAYNHASNEFERALKEAYSNFVEKAPKKLTSAFEKYKKENASWLQNDALYEALSIENGNDYWPMWKNEEDKHLLNPKSNEERMKFGDRIKDIEKKYAKEIDFYSFCQFVINTQNVKTRDFAKKNDIKMIADRQVAFSDRDCWAYQSLFMDGWCLGCPPDYFSKDGQAWGFPVLDPQKMFKEDGSLGKGGQVMKALFKKMFKENPGGVRIDHIVGLIDPWVYKAGKKPKIEEGAGRLYSSPEHSELSKFAIPQMSDLDTTVEADKEKRVKKTTPKQIEKYASLIEKIVIDAAKEEGLDKDSIVCEDLGTLTNPVAAVLKKYDMLGMKLTQFVDPEVEEHPYRCKNIPKRTWAMVGTHDNRPISMWADDMINTHEGYLHAKNLVEDMYAEADNKDDLIVKMTNDVKFLMDNKLAEIFASKAENIQIFFTDFFGIKDVYNTPGTSGDANWSLRLPNDYENLYNENLKSGVALDLPKILAMAIKARGSKFAEKNKALLKQLEA